MKKNFSLFSTLSTILALYLMFRKSLYFIYRKISKIGYVERISYSQGAEDLILKYIFRDQNSGVYVDVGCNHPVDSNNTFLFYLNNWNGVNIDGNEKLIKLFKKVRPKDISINALISDDEYNVNYYQSSSDKVSTIDTDFYNQNKSDFEYPNENIVEAKTTTLTKILNSLNLPNFKIDLLTIDVEGIDIKVLKGLDFNIYKPKVICIECHNINLENLNKNEVYEYLIEKGYSLKYHAISSCFFILN